MGNFAKKSLVCITGIVLSVVLFSALIEIDVVYKTLSTSIGQSLQSTVESETDETLYRKAFGTSQRIDYIYLPLVALFTSIFIGIVENEKKARIVITTLSLLPIFLFHIISSVFLLKESVLILGYSFLAGFVVLFFPRLKKARHE